MLNDPHFKVIYYEADSKHIFPNVNINGGIAITYRNSDMEFGAIGTFTQFSELNSILRKVRKITTDYLDSIISSPLSYKLSPLMLKEHPDSVGHLRTSAFSNLSEIFYQIPPNDGREYIAMIGLSGGKRETRYVRRDYIIDSSNTLDCYSVLMGKANGAAGTIGTPVPARICGVPIIAPPGTGYTQTFISIGAFEKEQNAKNLTQYILSKFARAMLGILKITQDCPGPKWAYVPL